MLSALVTVLLATLLVFEPAHAQIADVPGPGAPVPEPAAQCPRTFLCRYTEQNFLPDGYRVQSLEVCGANCTSQYWVSNMTDGEAVLEIDPTRGGAILAVQRDAGEHPPVRVVRASYAPTDAACCPSAFSDTTYTWDAASNSLVAGQPTSTPAEQFPGYDATRQELSAEGWIVAAV
jgi:hypothetical protein